MSLITTSHQMMTVICEHHRLTTSLMHSGYDLSYSDLTALTTLLEHPEPVPTPWLCDYLMLERKTVWNILIKLEDRQLITKEASATDGRTMLLGLSAAGKHIAEQANEDLAELIHERFLTKLQDEEFFEFMRSSSEKSCDILRGHPVLDIPITANQILFFGSSHLLLWRTLLHRWREAVRPGNLSLSAYRILNLLEHEEKMTPSTLADTLRLPRSNTSMYVHRLIQENLVHEVPDAIDERQKRISLTKPGVEKLTQLNSRIDAATEEAHRALPRNGQLVVDAWYLRMYANLSQSPN